MFSQPASSCVSQPAQSLAGCSAPAAQRQLADARRETAAVHHDVMERSLVMCAPVVAEVDGQHVVAAMMHRIGACRRFVLSKMKAG